MRFGFVTMFAWRPHVEHMHYIAALAREAGHEARFLVCDADLPTCYTRELHATSPAWLECLKCRAGGLRSYEMNGVSSIGSLGATLPVDDLQRFEVMARSSASTLGRFESDADYASPLFHGTARRLAPTVALAYDATRRWIEREQLEAIFVFNGRMDATRGVLEAARASGVRSISLERTWFGDGIQLLPDEHCLGLRSVDRMMTDWRDVPLTLTQAQRAARIVAARFLRRNVNEWRAYNVDARDAPWPTNCDNRRILFLPGSRNEVWGFPDVEGIWAERTRALDHLIDRLGLAPSHFVLRCHPNWAENIGAVTGECSERYYTEWARDRGVSVVASRDRTSTLSLMSAADAIVVNGGTAALEAGVLGKQVIALTPSTYQHAGFQTTAYDEDDVRELTLNAELPAAQGQAEAARIARQTLRFAHTMIYRVAQFVPFVRLCTTTRYQYYMGADPLRVANLARSGTLVPDDDVGADTVQAEGGVLEQIAARRWEDLHNYTPGTEAVRRPVRRRMAFRMVDALRDRLPRGDL